MFISTIVAITEASLLSIEASRVMALRMQVIMRGGVAARDEADLLIREKSEAFGRAFLDLSGGASGSDVCSDLRAIVRANHERLSADNQFFDR